MPPRIDAVQEAWFVAFGSFCWSFFLLAAIYLVESRQRGPALALRKFDVQPGGSRLLTIEGRESGLLSYLVSLTGIESVTLLDADRERIHFSKVGAFGQKHDMAPLRCVASCHCTVRNPWWIAALGGVQALAGLCVGLRAFVVLLAMAVLYFAAWRVLRGMSFAVHTFGGMAMRLGFMPGVLDGVAIDIRRAILAADVLNNAIIASGGGADPAHLQSAEREPSSSKSYAESPPQWHVVVQGKREGPVSTERIAQWLAAGRIDREALAWRKGMADWQALSTIPELNR